MVSYDSCPKCGGRKRGRASQCRSCQLVELRASRPSRFWDRVDRRGPDECWEWQGYRNPKGYGMWRGVHTNQTAQAQRVAYELAIGPVPDGLWVLHHCDNPPCCNPAHLWLGTPRENSLDMVAKGRNRNGAIKNPPTHCPQGHDYAVHGYRPGRAQRLACRFCGNERRRRRRLCALAA